MTIAGNWRQGARLLLVSFLALYFEVVLIRWVPGQVQIIGYFANLVLIACFLGLGIGCATWQRGRDHEWSFLRWLTILAGICLAISKLGMVAFGLDAEAFGGPSHGGPFPTFLVAVMIFVVTALSQVPLGRMLGAALSPFSPLPGYSLNLLGSLLGVSAMAVLRYLSIGPIWWFSIGLALFVPLALSLPSRRLRAWMAGAGVAIMALVAVMTGKEIWSPYYKIKIEDSATLIKVMTSTIAEPLKQAGYSISINDTFFQYALNLDPIFIQHVGADQPLTQRILSQSLAFYQIPYETIQPRSVLILGAGSGNDTAMAVMNRVPHIVAVEIDPVIAKMGQDLHPLLPYRDPPVHVVIDDARHYLRTTPEKFDLIVYGLLDSHRLIAQLSTVRLESFVYTREGLAEAAARLNPGGAIVLTHASDQRTPQQARLFQELSQIFPGHVHGVFLKDFFWYTIVAGPENLSDRLTSNPLLKNVTAEYLAKPAVKLATDDWPFIYLTTESFLTTGYFMTLQILVWVSLIITAAKVPAMRKSIPLHFFLLGAGFLLLETKAIIDLSLLFGSTWLVNTIAIGAFLTMALLANLATHLFKFQRTWPFYLLLGLALAVSALVPAGKFLAAGWAARALLGGGFVALPVFFSGIIFAVSFKKTASPAAALGANVMGAVIGGFLEYTSLFMGYRFLYLVAALLYLGSAAAIMVKDRGGQSRAGE
jgi:spermidine synthase